jgi:D-arginine dehydrogenase
MRTADVIVIGGGIAGASAAYELGRSARVLLLEAESQPGFHATGRSAALFTETYGNAVVRALTRASRAFYEEPPAEFPADLLTPRGTLHVATDAERAELAALLADPDVRAATKTVSTDEALRLVPILKPDSAVEALFEPGAMDVDTAALHQACLRGARARAAEIVTDARVTALERRYGLWRLETTAGPAEAPMVIDAAGAWADEVARLAGLPPAGLAPLRRTAITIAAPDGLDPRPWPMVIAADESVYFKPDAGRILVSPADETPSEACDVQPEEEDVAMAAWRFEEMTGRPVRRIESRWAGLRTFAPDRTPVVGPDPDGAGFFWLAGQGGYGFQTAPALARLTAALALGEALPLDLAAISGLTGAVQPGRFRDG